MQDITSGSIDCIITDQPYGETSLKWDRLVTGWASEARRVLAPHGSLWLFGSLRSLIASSAELAGWTLAQDLIWEKHNGSSSAADRFRRVHEQVAQFYPSDRAWADVYKKPLFTSDATARVVRRKQRPPHWGELGESVYISEDGGPRLMRSVMFFRSEHGRAEHETQKPVAIISPLIEYSCPAGGVILDPFAGSGTTGIAARQCGRNAILIERDPQYAEMARRRIAGDAPLFTEVAAE
jgi:site-specific DNA-methyltransferase (adenine-specific)